MKKKITETPCSTECARDRDSIVTTDNSRIGLGIPLWRKQNDITIRPIAFANRCLNYAEKNCSIGELEVLAVVWGLENFRFYL